MAKVTLIGAGSVVFAKNLLGDILSFPSMADAEIALMDIDPDRLHTANRVAHKVAKAVNARPHGIVATKDRREALRGADYVITMIQVGGFEPCTVTDFEIPKKYGLRQTIADTLGIGGIMRGLRTIPVLLDIARDMRELCPNALLLQYVNPMAMNCWALNRAGGVRNVGLCHSVQGTAMQLCSYVGVPYEQVTYRSAGINHMSFFIEFKLGAENLYNRLFEVMKDPEVFRKDAVRFEMMKHLGYFVTESSEHFSEYVPHFIRRDRPDLIDRFLVPLDEYIRRCEEIIEVWERWRIEFESDDPIEVKRSAEYGSLIVDSCETNTPRVIYGNVPNTGIITNLMPGCTVEVPCLVDGMGIQPTHIGDLPPQLAGYISTNVSVQCLTVEAALTGKRDYVYQAAMLDPHTAAELTIDEIKSLVDDLIEAHGNYIPPMY
ncbi:MAG: alpha-glucosidase/alpha-galactosidase [Fimbriimonadia bacterium]